MSTARRATRVRTAPSSPPRHAGVDGRPTRGKTATNRLRRTDTFLLLDRPSWLRSVVPRYADVGFGHDPSTTLETLHRLSRRQPRLRVYGIELDPERVANAMPFTIDDRLGFTMGGFELPVADGGPLGCIRAMNVLRQYDEPAHRPAIERMSARLADGGVLLEGTSSPTGRLLAMNVYEPQPGVGAAPERPPASRVLRHRVVLSPNLRRSWSPLELRTVLPKNLIHHAEPGSPLDRFFARWQRTWTVAHEQPVGAGAAFEQAAIALADAGYDIDRRRTLLRRGFLILRDPTLLAP